MRSISPVKAALGTVLLLSSWLHAGIYYEQEIKMPARPGMPAVTTKQTWYISGPKMRAEMVVRGMKTVTIARYDTGVSYTVMPTHKMFMQVAIPKPNPQKEAAVQVSVKKTDETKKIGRYNSTRYDVTVDGRLTRYWLTTEVDLGDELATLWQGVGQAQSSKLARQMAELKGFPVMLEIVTPQGTVTATVTKVERRNIPDSMFEVPAGYRGMPAGSP